ncbi:Uncharacterised protein [Escherichia coli]|nr:Uncharacterised protein [Escherichia coli]
MLRSKNQLTVIITTSPYAEDLFRFTLSLIHFYLTGSPLSF